MDSIIEKLKKIPVEKEAIEIVERKGIGHPDSLTDGLCEASSRVLCKHYIEEKGFIHHHNLDKGLLVGGVSDPSFGGGQIIEPPDVIIAGTATILGEIDDTQLLIYEEVEKYLQDKLRFTHKLNPEIKTRIHPGSADLVGLYDRFGKGETPLANDTSFGVGFAPLTTLENLVLSAEKFLNSNSIKGKYPFIGEDIKVMGIRKNREMGLTCAIAFVSEFVDSLEQYYEHKKKIKEVLEKKFGSDIKFFINTADSGESIYMTISGTSWENGDDGQTGRGNRINGLITPNRTMSLEAAAGKNPISHVGKIYNLKAQEIADKISELFGPKEVSVHLLSQIGKPINQPNIGIKYISNDGLPKKEIQQILDRSLSEQGFKELTEKLLNGSVSVF